MAFDFRETFKVALPNVESDLAHFSEASYKKGHGLIVEIAAIHEGTTSNFNHYPADALSASLESWLKPYAKPILLHHNKEGEPVGRVIGAAMAEEDGKPYVRLQAAITDPVAIQKVMDKRYLTGSVGGRANEAVCNICSVDWANPTESRSLPCSHRRGKVYRGKVAMLEMRNISFQEYSFVNVPADSNSSIRHVEGIGELAESEDWGHNARFFVLDMNRESVLEYSESGSFDVLAEMKKKDASPLYLEMKGAFLEAQILDLQESVKSQQDDTNALDGIVSDSEENLMTQENDTIAESEDDILAVAEGLSDDLAAVADEAEDVVDEAVEGDESETEEGERPEGQEKARSADVDPETSKGAPKSRESDDEEPEVVEEEEATEEEAPVAESEEVTDTDATEESEEVEEGDQETEEDAGEAELDADEQEGVEQEASELQTRIDTLEEENKRLRQALHRMLAERVVDTKIALGMEESDNRTAAIEEHSTRTASSLADTLRDLARVQPAGPRVVVPVESTVVAVEDEDNATTIDEEEALEEEVNPLSTAEKLFTDVLMGRRPL